MATAILLFPATLSASPIVFVVHQLVILIVKRIRRVIPNPTVGEAGLVPCSPTTKEVVIRSGIRLRSRGFPTVALNVFLWLALWGFIPYLDGWIISLLHRAKVTFFDTVESTRAW